MLVDFHTHLSPPSWARGPMPPVLTDVAGFFSRKEADGIDVAVLVNAMVNLPGAPVDNLSLDRVREWNEFAASLVQDHPGRLEAFVGVNPFGGAEMLEELRQAVREGPFRGVAVNSSVDGEYLDSPRANDFWALAAELDVPVFIHPPSNPPGGDVGDTRVQEYVARAQDVALSIASLLFGGVLERHPGLRVIAAAGAGGLAAMTGRLEVAARYGSVGPPGGHGQPGRPQAEPAAPRADALRQIYVDSCVFSAPSLLCTIGAFGADRVLFGTDSPPLAVPAQLTLDLLAELPVDDEEKERIRSRNALELLNVERPAGVAS